MILRYRSSLSQNQQVNNGFLGVDDTRHWVSISNLFKKMIKMKGCLCPDWLTPVTVVSCLKKGRT